VKKKIVVIIGGRGIGDLIYHLPLLKSLYKTFGEKIYIVSNKINQSKEVFKNEVFYKKIIEFDNHRFGIFKTIKNIFIFKKKINDLKPKYIYLTSNTTRLLIPVLLSNAEKKYIIGNKSFIFNKNKSLNSLTFSQKILKFTKDLKLPKRDFSFLLNNQKLKINKKLKRNKIFMVIDSHHDQNNWPTENFIKIIRKLIRRNLIYINFSPNKKYLLQNFPSEIRKSKNIVFTHKKKISEIIDIIYSCNTVIGNETGPVCLGSALQKKIHAIYTPLHTLPESKIINKKNAYYNTYRYKPEVIIKKILNSI